MRLDLTGDELELFKKWVDMDKEGWPIKDGCPPEIRKWIEDLLSLFGED